MLTETLPRFRLGHLPTPLEEMPRLREALGENCPRLWVKRDDQTGLATGGNKTRKLEFLIGLALAERADTIITTGGPQSNHCRQAAAAAVRAGLRCVLATTGEPIPRDQWTGNLLLSELLGAEIRWSGDANRNAFMAEIAEELRQQGAKPYIIPLGGSIPAGCVGYVAAVEELAAQLTKRDIPLDRIVLTAGSGGTHAGVLVGVKALGLDVKVEGMVNFAIPDLADTVRTLVDDTAAYLGLDLTFRDADFIFHEAVGTHNYGVITEAERDALYLLARTEAIVADPIYTGRTLAQMCRLIEQGVYQSDENILFWHTGGTTGLFPRAAEIMAASKS